MGGTAIRPLRGEQVGRPRPHQDGRPGLGRDRIRVDAIHPGAIATPFITGPAVGSDTPISDFYSAEPFAIPRPGEPVDITRTSPST